MAHPSHPQIQGSWTAVDNSKNCLEIAPTENPEVVALRDSYDQREMIFATPNQIQQLAESVQKGRLRNLVGK